MSTRRPAEELSLTELERLVLVRRREERMRRLHARGIERELPELPEAAPALPDSGSAEPPQAGRDTLAFLTQSRRRRGRAVGDAPAPWHWRERLLLLAEIVGLAGLIIAILLFVADLRRINADAAATQAAALAPVAAPERPEILPGGSAPPQEAAAVPAIYRNWIEPVGRAAVPLGDLSSEERPTRIRIAKIGVDAPVVVGDDWEALKQGAGHHIGSADPGERGNVVISAHNDIFGEIFRDLNQLGEGDEVEITDAAGRHYTYRVQSKRIVEPTDVSVLDKSSEPIVTLITCHPYLVDSHRLIVVAELVP